MARRADLVWEVEHPSGQRGILHIEIQTKVEADIGERVAEYGLRLWRREHRPVWSVVLFLRPAASVPSSPFVLEWIGREVLRYAFDVIRLGEIPQQRILRTSEYALWPLASLAEGASVESTLAIVDQIAVAPIPPSERSELTWLLVLLAGIRLPQRELLAALRRKDMIEDLWKESSLAGALEERAKEHGMAEVLQAVLESRFGPVSEDVLAALDQMDGDTLREIGTHIAVDSLAQIRARLGLA